MYRTAGLFCETLFQNPSAPDHVKKLPVEQAFSRVSGQWIYCFQMLGNLGSGSQGVEKRRPGSMSRETAAGQGRKGELRTQPEGTEQAQN